MSRKVTCVTRETSGFNSHRRITGIGDSHAGTSWTMTELAAIRAIEVDKERFYVSIDGLEVDLIVKEHDGRKYLATKADGTTTNNLSNLPDCR